MIVIEIFLNQMPFINKYTLGMRAPTYFKICT